jgi:hypothetical protein
MAASQQEIMTAKLFFNAAFPVMQVLLDDVPKLHEKFRSFKAVVQFGALDGGELLCCHLIFDDGAVKVVQGPAPKYDLALTFPRVEKMNALLRGGLALPSVRGRLSLLPNVLSLLMGLMIMSPKKTPKDFPGQALKVKCSLYMITRALSQYNKLGDPDMQEFCRRQSDRIYQFTVANGDDPHYIACYLRIKAGKSKSGHGVYTRRTPFVHFSFKSVEGALKVLLKDVAFVRAVELGYVETIGSPEYACYLNDYMAILQGMMT